MTLVIVLGLHRSGTSVLMAGLRGLGLDLGEFDDIRDDNNPKGYAEHPLVRQFNERLLEHLDLTWDNWGFHAHGTRFDGPDFSSWRTEAAKLLDRLFGHRPQAALKDPRITMLLPFWQAVLKEMDLSVRWLMILRHPDEVAESQIRRLKRSGDSTPPESTGMAMQALWAVTMHATLMNLPQAGVLLVRHDRLLSAPGATLEAVALWLNIQPDARAADVVDRSLYRSRPSTSAEGGAWGIAARGLWGALTASLDGPRPLTSAQGHEIAAAQVPIITSLPSLPAVRGSLAALHRQATVARAQAAGARAAVWALSAVAQRHAPPEALAKLLDSLDRIAAENAEDMPLGITRAQLAIGLGRKPEAAEVLAGLCKLYPRNPLPERMLSDLKC